MQGDYTIILTPQEPDGVARLTRSDLFRLAQPLANDPEDDAPYLTLLWHVLSWGSGTSRRNNLDRINAFVKGDARGRNVRLLRDATRAARSGNPREAYGTLIRRGGGMIPSLGPAFFTKYLYFAGAGTVANRCLILDARVATSLHEAGWSTIPRGSYNWYTDMYAEYVDLLHRWAETITKSGIPTQADEIERALFTRQNRPGR
ncbi:hypothetical protein KCQ71_04575 [Ruania sp. N2-46]|uniref:Uncharacterized protein n=1 Tax=Occultella gossypii TaxID=2800820 RepID=A0ABS7S731_9MICO|nr:hypothetical protein [Occultella gossypii]MBZ2195414.1 hypothetical protein [Occultella gossypii]